MIWFSNENKTLWVGRLNSVGRKFIVFQSFHYFYTSAFESSRLLFFVEVCQLQQPLCNLIKVHIKFLYFSIIVVRNIRN